MICIRVLLGMVLCFLSLMRGEAQTSRWQSDKGHVAFTSNAPLEIIKAESHSLQGAIHASTREVAFKISIISFQGFNSDLQRVHFLENYLEQKKFPNALFSGKIIEDINLQTPGIYNVRVKGMLNIHGIVKERIIKGTILVTQDGVNVESHFSIPVSDHGIAIPRVVQQKIADQILVSINMEFRTVIK